MKLYIDTDQKRFITSNTFKSGLKQVEFMAGDSASLEVVFVTGNTALSATADKQIIFGVKQKGFYTDGELLVTTSDYTALSSSYLMNPNFDTVALNALLHRNDSLSANDIDKVDCNMQIKWSEDSGVSWNGTNILPTVIYHDLFTLPLSA